MKKKMTNYTGSDLGDDFKRFFKSEKRRITKILTDMGCTDIVMSMQFYYFYGYFTSKTGQPYYFSCSDTRHFGYTQLLYRTVKDYDDCTGGGNQYVSKNYIKEMKLK